jgi:hypothetical protein
VALKRRGLPTARRVQFLEYTDRASTPPPTCSLDPIGKSCAFGCVLGLQECVSTIADQPISDGTKLHQGATLWLHRCLRGGVRMNAVMQIAT